MKMASKPHSMWEPAEEPWATALIPYMSVDVWWVCRCYNIWKICSATTLHSSWLTTKTLLEKQSNVHAWCTLQLRLCVRMRGKKELFRPKSKSTKLLPGEGKWKKLAIAKHAWGYHQQILWEETSVPVYWTKPPSTPYRSSGRPSTLSTNQQKWGCDNSRMLETSPEPTSSTHVIYAMPERLMMEQLHKRLLCVLPSVI